MAYSYRLKDTTGSFDKGVRTYTKTWQVLSDDTAIGPGQACALAPGNLYESWVYGTEVDLLAILVKKSGKAVPNQGGMEWEVTSEYSSAPISVSDTSSTPGSSDAAVQPDLRVWTVAGTGNKTTKVLRVDAITGDKVCNSAGQPFDPPVEVPKTASIFTYSGWKAPANDTFDNKIFWEDTINNANVTLGPITFPIRTARCNEYHLETTYEHGQAWWKKTVVIEYNPDKWNPIKVLDQGAYEKYSSMSGQKYRQLTDENGNPAVLPLDGTGHKLAAGSPLVFLEFNGYRETNFTGIL